ncbi:hypothetical protein BUZ34_05230 [Staphylococcus haemolyticus]|uniref:hypothetical protein n=1 Tax=Staphylococcus haemolyticus TaxID=1283 RepID=UPI000E6A8D00|nr:hypothetical protein [Staphylococcus haemolyticus]RIO63546.1 hypothetical protein BUZ34_05230 [Staphylococcus haemolyticus]
MRKKLFHEIITELVDRERRIRSEKREYLASQLNLTESYLRKIHSPSTDKHYSLEHLYLLSLHWNISITCLIPSLTTLKLLPAYQNLSKKEQENIMNKIKKSISEEENE